MAEARDRMKEGLIGDVYMARGLVYKWRDTIGRAPVEPVPAGVHYDLWLGPAPQRPFKGQWPKDHYALTQLKAAVDWVQGYRGVYHPFNFRGWWDFGTGALGDMGCHLMEAPFKVLGLKYPTDVTASIGTGTTIVAPPRTLMKNAPTTP